MAKEKLIPFDIQNYLEDEKDCQLYLQACVVEDSGDGKLIKKALEDIARAENSKKQDQTDWKTYCRKSAQTILFFSCMLETWQIEKFAGVPVFLR